MLQYESVDLFPMQQRNYVWETSEVTLSAITMWGRSFIELSLKMKRRKVNRYRGKEKVNECDSDTENVNLSGYINLSGKKKSIKKMH